MAAKSEKEEEPKEDAADEEFDTLVLEPEDTSIIHIGLIADKDVTLGLLLAGIGYHRESFRNYLMLEPDTPMAEIEEFFHALYKQPNIGVILLDYPTAKRMTHLLENCKKLLPVVIILPTKATIVPYMEEKERLRRQRQRDTYI